MRTPEETTRGAAFTLEPGPSGWTVELRDLPGEADAALAVGRQLLEAAATTIAGSGGGVLHHWARGRDELLTAISDAAGFRSTRDLWQMRLDLPVEEPWSLEVRPFVVGQDEEPWLAVNNRAFAWHPEQGHRTMAELKELEVEPWFDPAGFLLHEVDGKLVGFCWTKVHADETPPLGEIYVIAVDPSAHQRGLGRQLVLAGLDHLHRSGLPCGMLYVEATNNPATKLYRDLGFKVHRVDTAHSLEVPAQ
jgi:mycothiol synthase